MLAAIPPLGPWKALRRRPAAARPRPVLGHGRALRHRRRRHGGPARPAGLYRPPQGPGPGAARGRPPGSPPCPPTKIARTIYPCRPGPLKSLWRRPGRWWRSRAGPKVPDSSPRPGSWTRRAGWAPCRWSRPDAAREANGGRCSAGGAHSRSAARSGHAPPERHRALPVAATPWPTRHGSRASPSPTCAGGLHDREPWPRRSPATTRPGSRRVPGLLPPAGAGDLFEPGAAGAAAPPPAARPAAGAGTTEPGPPPPRRWRTCAPGGRLLDRTRPASWRNSSSPRRSAPCAGRTGARPRPLLLRRALAGAIVDTPTLHWLGSTELAQACKEGGQRNA